MGKVVQLNQKRVFTQIEANELLPIIKRITEEANSRIKGLLTLVEATRDIDEAKTRELEEKISSHVEEWQSKIAKLGAEGKGLWLVDFDSGTGYFCWKYPEAHVEHHHGYQEGFQARVRLTKPVVVKEQPVL
ncbi:MAG: DUF2203 family protein [Oligoflexia bacterium]|nr:DUF2203 family protein [Oligoflexia bacterium]